MRWPRWFPPLSRTHPNFFLIFGFGTLVFHAYEGMVGLLGSDLEFSSKGLVMINDFAAHETWGVAHVVVAVAMFVGLYPKLWQVARAGLLAGFILVGVRLSLLLATYWEGNLTSVSSPGYLWLVMIVHLAQLREPPFNPEAELRSR